MLRYFKVWLLLSISSFHIFFTSRLGAILFLTGKIFRFILYLGFLIILVSKTKILAGYDIWQVLLFYFTFNFIDSATQMLFREVYRFRSQIIGGNFDLLLVKPFNVLFRVLFGWTDLLDFLTLIPFIILIYYVMSKLSNITLIGVFFYIIMIINAFLIALSFHIIVLALAVLTTEIDHAIMIYRDITGMGKFPIDIYKEPLRSLITFVIPVGVMMSFPVKSLVGLLSTGSVFLSMAIGAFIFTGSIFFWRYSLKKYSSASS